MIRDALARRNRPRSRPQLLFKGFPLENENRSDILAPVRTNP